MSSKAATEVGDAGVATRARPRRPASLRGMLALLLSGGMLVVLLAELTLTWHTAVVAADAAYDRSLLGAIKSIDANISTESGGLGVELPYRMLEFFQLTASGSVYFRVATEDGLVEIGEAQLPPPPRTLRNGEPSFVDTEYFGQPVRLGSYARVLDRPIGGQAGAQRVVIQVAETLDSREQFTRALVFDALARDLVLVATSILVLLVAVGVTLRPLERLRHDVAGRREGDLTPVATEAIPTEVRPLVQAINQHVDRNRRLLETQRRFIDDASHQLRTPLATLGTQVGFALRESDPQRLREALQAVKEQLDDTVRQTNQMLALGRADSATLPRTPVDLVAFAGEVTRGWWREAAQRSIDLGLEAPAEPLVVPAHAGLLKEALANLLHNAIRYTPEGGQVTVRVEVGTGELAGISVIDNGPGLDDVQLARAGERFFRGSRGEATPGSGLGLAIVRSIAERHGGRMVCAHGEQGQGLAVSLMLPRSMPPAAG